LAPCGPRRCGFNGRAARVCSAGSASVTLRPMSAAPSRFCSPMHGPSQQAGGADSLRSLAGLLDERLARGTGVS
jgi:hypothetical protein